MLRNSQNLNASFQGYTNEGLNGLVWGANARRAADITPVMSPDLMTSTCLRSRPSDDLLSSPSPTMSVPAAIAPRANAASTTEHRLYEHCSIQHGGKEQSGKRKFTGGRDSRSGSYLSGTRQVVVGQQVSHMTTTL